MVVSRKDPRTHCAIAGRLRPPFSTEGSVANISLPKIFNLSIFPKEQTGQTRGLALPVMRLKHELAA